MTLSSAKQAVPVSGGWKIPLWFKISMFSAIVLGGLYLIFFMSTASVQGEVTGQITHFSKRGVLFKTFEGKLKTETDLKINGEKLPAGSTWHFTIGKDDPQLIQQMKDAGVGARVKITFQEKYFRFFWQADSRNVVEAIEKL
jgi:hypothetical protein